MSEVPFDVVLDGTARGLSVHRLSLNAFAKALSMLSKAIARTANEIVSQAAGSRGPLSAQARLVDFEISGLHEGCVHLRGVITAETPHGETWRLFDTLPARTAKAFIDHVQNERSGIPSSKFVRDYLASLPAGVARQVYRTVIDGHEYIADVGPMTLTSSEAMPGALLRGRGSIVGAKFPPGPSEVSLRLDGKAVSAGATPDQVEHALNLRGVEVEAMILVDRRGRESRRLLWLREVSLAQPAPSPDARTAMILNRWTETLAELAR